MAGPGYVGHVPVTWTLVRDVDVAVLLQVEAPEALVGLTLLGGVEGVGVHAAVAVGGARVVAEAVATLPVVLHALQTNNVRTYNYTLYIWLQMP